MPPATAITAYPDLERLPLFSIPKNCTLETDETAMAAYYANRPLMWRNIAMIGICNLGWSTVFALIGPLMALRVLDIGSGEYSSNDYLCEFMGGEFFGDVVFVDERSHHLAARTP